MSTRKDSVFPVVFLGGLLAALASWLVFGANWWSLVTATAIGAVVGYIGADLKGFVEGIRSAWKQARVWEPNKLYWRAFFSVTIFLLAIGSTGSTFALIYSTIQQPRTGILLIDESVIWCIFTAPIIFGFSIGWGLRIISPLGIEKTSWRYRKEMARIIRDFEVGAKHTNPIAVMYWTLWAIVWLIRHIPDVATFIAETFVEIGVEIKRFGQLAVLYVHNSRRTFCCYTTSACAGLVWLTYWYTAEILFAVVIGVIVATTSWVQYNFVAPRYGWLPKIANGNAG